jgi:hypothetical protein
MPTDFLHFVEEALSSYDCLEVKASQNSLVAPLSRRGIAHIVENETL